MKVSEEDASGEVNGLPLCLAGSSHLLLKEALLVLIPLGQPPQPVLPQPGHQFKENAHLRYYYWIHPRRELIRGHNNYSTFKKLYTQ